MNRPDRRRWRQAATMADLGELVVDWLNGTVEQTPSHLAPPDPETIPLIPALTAVNRAGFVTENSQLAETREGRSWNTWVAGFASERALRWIREAVDGTPLVLRACRGRAHECGKRLPWGFCPGKEARGYWRHRSPDAAGELANAWWVMLCDPEPGRNDLLWASLEKFATRGERR